MAEKHPYVTSPGGLIKVINHLRKSFPSALTSDSIKKLGFAPKNESYIISTLRFLQIIDQENNKTDKAGKVFSNHEDNKFQHDFSEMVKNAYQELFSLHGDTAWKLDVNQLITFFRHNDQSSAVVGKRQANTFQTLCGLSGKQILPEMKEAAKIEPAKRNNNKISNNSKTTETNITNNPIKGKNDFGLTVRIEINLPADGSQETYDQIFRSIKENLLNG